MSFLQPLPLGVHNNVPEHDTSTSLPTAGGTRRGGEKRSSAGGPAGRHRGPAASVKSSGNAALLTNVVHFVRDPLGALGQLADGLGGSSFAVASDLDPLKAVEKRKKTLYEGLKNAYTFEEWRSCAEELDRLEGHELWKAETQSPDYDVELVQTRLKELDDARRAGDVDRMIYLVRTALTRGLGDMGNVRLYRHSHMGTKILIERYISSALETLKALLSVASRPSFTAANARLLLQQMLSARQSFGRSAMLLSGGAMLGLNHIGVLKALWEARLLPRIISGASAGSIISAVLCTHTDDEIPTLLEEFPQRNLAVFDRDGDDTVLRRVSRLLKVGALLDISHLTHALHEYLGELTFQEAYNRTRRILNICVSTASVYELPRLLNYVTAPNVLIWSAVAASCSVPLLFTSASVMAKDPKTGRARPWNPSPQRYIDGSVDNDLPMTRLAEMFNVNHFIVSQVNPHVIPFLSRDDAFISPEQEAKDDGSGGAGRALFAVMNLAKAEALHRMHVLAELGVFPNALGKARSVLSQKYSGDITIVPDISYADFPRMLQNPTPAFVRQAMLAGERATWPKLSRVRNHCAIELALDDAVQQLRARVVFSPSQVDLRRMRQAQGVPRPLQRSAGAAGAGAGIDDIRVHPIATTAAAANTSTSSLMRKGPRRRRRTSTADGRMEAGCREDCHGNDACDDSYDYLGNVQQHLQQLSCSLKLPLNRRTQPAHQAASFASPMEAGARPQFHPQQATEDAGSLTGGAVTAQMSASSSESSSSPHSASSTSSSPSSLSPPGSPAEPFASHFSVGDDDDDDGRALPLLATSFSAGGRGAEEGADQGCGWIDDDDDETGRCRRGRRRNSGSGGRRTSRKRSLFPCASQPTTPSTGLVGGAWPALSSPSSSLSSSSSCAPPLSSSPPSALLLSSSSSSWCLLPRRPAVDDAGGATPKFHRSSVAVPQGSATATATAHPPPPSAAPPPLRLSPEERYKRLFHWR